MTLILCHLELTVYFSSVLLCRCICKQGHLSISSMVFPGIDYWDKSLILFDLKPHLRPYHFWWISISEEGQMSNLFSWISISEEGQISKFVLCFLFSSGKNHHFLSKLSHSVFWCPRVLEPGRVSFFFLVSRENPCRFASWMFPRSDSFLPL